MSPVYCGGCGRANGESAQKCIWCGMPLADVTSAGVIETTKVEIGYLGGIDRFEDPCPVYLTIRVSGIEVTEVIPGTRSVNISAASIVNANVVDASTMAEGKRVRPTWWWFALGPLAFAIPGKRTSEQKKHDYILTIRYKKGSEIRNAVFHREDRSGLVVVEGLVRILTSLVRQTNGR